MLLSSFRGHVRAQYPALNHDCRLAAPHRQHRRGFCLRWDSCCGAFEPSTCLVDTDPQLCALGHGNVTSDGGVGHVLSSVNRPQTPATGVDCIGFLTPRSSRPGWICHPTTRTSRTRHLSNNRQLNSRRRRYTLHSGIHRRPNPMGLRPRLALLRPGKHFTKQIPLQHGMVGIHLPPRRLRSLNHPNGERTAQCLFQSSRQHF